MLLSHSLVTDSGHALLNASRLRAAELNFFALSLPFAKLGGVAPCGYSGGFNTVTATVGPLTNSRSLPPLGVEVPANGTTFDGMASSTANYGILVAGAHANISAPVTNGDALFSSMGAATFTDFLNASSPFVAVASAGFVRYTFVVDGTLSALGAAAPFFFGETYAEFDISHNGAATQGIMNATVRRGSLPTIRNSPPPAGWTTSTGALSGTSTFLSLDFPIVWGTPLGMTHTAWRDDFTSRVADRAIGWTPDAPARRPLSRSPRSALRRRTAHEQPSRGSFAIRAPANRSVSVPIAMASRSTPG